MNALTDQQLADYERDGYLFVRGLFTGEEISVLTETVRNDHKMDQALSLIHI